MNPLTPRRKACRFDPRSCSLAPLSSARFSPFGNGMRVGFAAGVGSFPSTKAGLTPVTLPFPPCPSPAAVPLPLPSPAFFAVLSCSSPNETKQNDADWQTVRLTVCGGLTLSLSLFLSLKLAEGLQTAQLQTMLRSQTNLQSTQKKTASIASPLPLASRLLHRLPAPTLPSLIL